MSEKHDKKNTLEAHRHALVVSVNASSHRNFPEPSLRYAEGDGESLGRLLLTKECNFAVSTLIGQEATAPNVKKEIVQLINEKGSDDWLLFYFIGHGYPVQTSDGSHEVFLATFDFDPLQAKIDPTSYVSLSHLQKMLLRTNEEANVLIILDCCFAGRILNEPAKELFFDAFIKLIEQTQRKKTPINSSEGDKATLTSTRGSAFEGLNKRGEGHVFMTGLILDALSGVDLTALNNKGNLTLPFLHGYLVAEMLNQVSMQGTPIMKTSASRDWILARHPARKPVLPPDATICHAATLDDLDLAQIRNFLVKQKDASAHLPEEAQMVYFNLIQEQHPIYAALLCFGRRPNQWITGIYTQCIHWIDTTRQGSTIDDANKEYASCLFQQFTEVNDFLQEHLGDQVSRGHKPEPRKIYYKVLEEALANALIHREYMTGPGHIPQKDGVMVEIFKDRIEISSPGTSPVGIEVLKKAPTKHPGSHPRNPEIMRLFYLAGYVARAGSGLARMQQWMQESGLQQPKFNLDQSKQTLTVTLFRPIQKNLSSRLKSRPFLALLSLVLIAGLVIGLMPGIRALANLFQPPPSTTIEIASDFPTSGPGITTGLPLQNGVQMAIVFANNNNVLPSGYTLKLASYDDTGSGNRPDPQKGKRNVEQAIADNLVAGIIGPKNSSVAEAEIPPANSAPIALFSPSTTYLCLTRTTDNPDCIGSFSIQSQVRSASQLTFFRLVTTDDLQGQAAADYLFKTKHYHKVLLLKDDSDIYSFGLAQSFQKEWGQLGGQVVPADLSQKSSTTPDYQSTLQAVAITQPDLIYFAGNNPNGTYVLQALSQIASLKTVAFAGGDGIVDNDFLQVAAQLHPMAPVYASLPLQDPGTDFKDNYIANGYSNYRAYAASSYDCTMMLIQAIKVALQMGVSTPHGAQDHAGAVHFRQAILQALSHLPYTGVTGTHSFDINGDTTNHTVSFYQLDFSTGTPQWMWLPQANA